MHEGGYDSNSDNDVLTGEKPGMGGNTGYNGKVCENNEYISFVQPLYRPAAGGCWTATRVLVKVLGCLSRTVRHNYGVAPTYV